MHDWRKEEAFSLIGELKKAEGAYGEFARLFADEDDKETDYLYRFAIYLAGRGANREIVKDYVKYLADKGDVQTAWRIISEYKEAVTDAEIKKELKKKIKEVDTDAIQERHWNLLTLMR